MSVLSLPVTLPDHEFASIRLRAENRTARTTSPFTLAAQIHVQAGQRWRAEVTLTLRKRADAEQYIAYLSELAGGVGEIHLGDPAGATPRGSWAGSPAVNGANQTGQTLDIDGLTANESGIALAGDYIELGSGTTRRLYKVLEDADADVNGEATLNIWPRLRESPGDNAVIVTADTRGTFEIPAQQFGWGWRPPSLTQISFTALEAI